MICLDLRAVAVRIGALVSALVLEAGMAAVPAFADEPKLPDLDVSANFTQTIYRPGDRVGLTVTILNLGSASATVHAVISGNVRFDQVGPWLDLAPDGPGVPVDPLDGKAFALWAAVPEQDDVVHVEISLRSDSEDLNPANNHVEVRVPIARTTGLASYSGTVFADKNDNSHADSDEGINLVQVTLNGVNLPPETGNATTDAQGRFAYKGIPVGSYSVHIVPPGGWDLHEVGDPVVFLTEKADIHDEFPVFRPMSETLTATVAFTKPVYAAGDTASLKVTLANTGRTTLTAIGAICTGSFEDGAYIGNGDAWGPLADGGPGVTIRPGEPTTFDVTSEVPEDAPVFGSVGAVCTFGPPGMVSLVVATAGAKVPGMVGTVRSVLIHDKNGVPNTKVVLLDWDTGAVAARAMTDATGHFAFTDVPAGRYEFRPIGPWKLVGGGPLTVLGGRVTVGPEEFVVPGAVQPDPDAPPSEEAPAPQGDVPPAAEAVQNGGTTLAATGVSVTGASVAGAVAVLIGCLLVLSGRRRAPADEREVGVLP